MSIISVVGPKGGIGKTTLAINTTAALTRALASGKHNNRICLVDLDLRLPHHHQPSGQSSVQNIL